MNLSPGQRILRSIAFAMLVVYLGWQIYWLAQGTIPPSLLLAATGIPAPTTGGTRSLRALLDGDWRLSLNHNAMTLPIMAISLYSFLLIVAQKCRGMKPNLPRRIVIAWVVILSLAWIIKLSQSFFAPLVG
jgi:Protein of unknown function (DUF2752)